MRPIKYTVALTDDERTRLEKIIKNKSTNQAIKKRSQILLDADLNHGVKLHRTEIAKYNRVSAATVGNAIKLFLDGGLDEVFTFKRGEGSNHSHQKIDGARPKQKLSSWLVDRHPKAIRTGPYDFWNRNAK
ncbi:MAG: hypothetical protein ABF651_10750 [Sporolactobacillus sp.]